MQAHGLAERKAKGLAVGIGAPAGDVARQGDGAGRQRDLAVEGDRQHFAGDECIGMGGRLQGE